MENIKQVQIEYQPYYVEGVLIGPKLSAKTVDLVTLLKGQEPPSKDVADAYYEMAVFMSIFPSVYKLLLDEGQQKEADDLLAIFQQGMALMFDTLGYDFSMSMSIKKRDNNVV